MTPKRLDTKLMIFPRKHSKNGKPNSQLVHEPPADGGRTIVLTAPLTEAIDHAGYFIQMAMASLPIWMEGIINRKYPKWREVEHNPDGSARYKIGRASCRERV